MDSSFPKARSFFYIASSIFIAFVILGINVVPEASSKIGSIDAKIEITRPEYIILVLYSAVIYFIFRVLVEWKNLSYKNEISRTSYLEVIVCYSIFIIISIYIINIKILNANYLSIVLVSSILLISIVYTLSCNLSINVAIDLQIQAFLVTMAISALIVYSLFDVSYLYSFFPSLLLILGYSYIIYIPNRIIFEDSILYDSHYHLPKLEVDFLGYLSVLKGFDPAAHSLYSKSQPSSIFSEQVRIIANNLLNKIKINEIHAQEKVPIILITSILPSEGKSCLAINISTVFSMRQMKVLLIDCDLRKPSVHKRLRLDNSVGISNYLTYQADLEEAVQTTIGDFDAIPAGPLSPSPMELVSSNRMMSLATDLFGKFDIIIIDSPPSGVAIADTHALSGISDYNILVSNQMINRKEFQSQLKKTNISIHGVTIRSNAQIGMHFDYNYYYYRTNLVPEKIQYRFTNYKKWFFLFSILFLFLAFSFLLKSSQAL